MIPSACALALLPLAFLTGCSLPFFNKTIQKSDPEPALATIVLGGGMAGLSSAVYLTQANIPTVLIAGAKQGGALSQSHSVRNWPGVLDAPGQDIAAAVAAQATAGGTLTLQEEVVRVDFSEYPFTIVTRKVGDANAPLRILKTHTCIIATGTEPRYLQIPGETGANGYWGRGVSNCAICEGSLYQGKTVGIVGGGDAAVVEANYLSDIANKVMIFIRKDRFRAKDIKSLNRALAKPNVSVIFETTIDSIHGDGKKLTHVITRHAKTNKTEQVALDGLFLAIGSDPNTKLFADQLQRDEFGFITLKNYQETSVPGIFAAGDVCDHLFVQAITAAGDGAKAALQAKRFLEENNVNLDQARSLIDAIKGGSTTPTSTPTQIATPEKKSTAPTPASPTAQAGQNGLTLIDSWESFEKEIVRSTKPVIIDIFAPLCITCKQVHSVLEELAKRFTNVSFVQLNAASKTLAIDKAIAALGGAPLGSVPTVLFVKQGKESRRIVGAMTVQDGEREIELLKK